MAPRGKQLACISLFFDFCENTASNNHHDSNVKGLRIKYRLIYIILSQRTIRPQQGFYIAKILHDL